MNGERILARGLAALLLLGVTACAPQYGGIDVAYISGHVGAEASSERFAVREGGIVVFSVDPESLRSRDYEVTDTVELTLENPDIARIIQGIAADSWMLVGTTRGRTVLEVRINGELEDKLPVDVNAQEVPR